MDSDQPCGGLGCGHARRFHLANENGWCEMCGVDRVRAQEYPVQFYPVKCDRFLETKEIAPQFDPSLVHADYDRDEFDRQMEEAALNFSRKSERDSREFYRRAKG